MGSPVYLLMLPACEKLALLTGIHRYILGSFPGEQVFVWVKLVQIDQFSNSPIKCSGFIIPHIIMLGTN